MQILTLTSDGIDGFFNRLMDSLATEQSAKIEKQPIDEQHNEHGTPTSPSTEEQYSAFNLRQKQWIITIVAFAGWFSSLSSFIYFPAIPFLAKDLNTSIDRINLTVTAYLIMSGIFPSIVGSAADVYGRRPVFLVTLAVYVGANIGLALQSSFTALFVLRMMQSAGISGSYAVTYGVLGDLFIPAERGGYSGIISFVLNTPPSIGPVISGLLLQRWNWRAIFWFLSIISPTCLGTILLFLPETARSVVGNGSISAKWYNIPLVPLLSPRNAHVKHQNLRSKAKQRRIPNLLLSLALLWDRGTLIIVSSAAVYYTIYSCLQASLASLFIDVYHTSGLVSGLVYLPFGVACAISAYCAGRVLDIDYRRTASSHGISPERAKLADLTSFPIEEARLRSIKYSLCLCCGLIAGYGWSVRPRVSMAVALVLQFFIGLSMQGVFTVLSTLLVDIHPDSPSTAQAASNLVRCELSAGGLALLDILLRRLGPGWCFTVFAAPGLLCVLLLYLLEIRGMNWRRTRQDQKTSEAEVELQDADRSVNKG